MKFKKVVTKNNWESITYHLQNDGSRCWPKPDTLKNEICVRFPDGETRMVKLVERSRTGHYSYHGKPGSATSTIYFVEACISGLVTEIPIDKLEISEIYLRT